MLEFQNIKKIFAKPYVPNWSEEVFVVSKIKNTASWTYVISDLNGELITKTFYQKEFQKTSQEKIRIVKVIKQKGDRLLVKLKRYDNSFNSWIDKNDIWTYVISDLNGELIAKTSYEKVIDCLLN